MKTATVTGLMAVTLLVYLCTVSGCGFAVPDKAEMSRTTSLDGALDVVITTYDVGATASTAYHIGIVSSGNHASEADDVIVADKLPSDSSVSVKWLAPRVVEIAFSEARLFKELPSATIGEEQVRVLVEVANRIE